MTPNKNCVPRFKWFLKSKFIIIGVRLSVGNLLSDFDEEVLIMRYRLLLVISLGVLYASVITFGSTKGVKIKTQSTWNCTDFIIKKYVLHCTAEKRTSVLQCIKCTSVCVNLYIK